MKQSGIINNINEIKKFLKEETSEYEILLVDDGSKDETWKMIKSLNSDDKNIKGLRFSRNFGKEAALMAGVNNANGEAVILMDADLQHPPRYMKDMIEKWKERI